jgi:predicted lipid-binding transport protein (Tim44 family)
MNGYESGGYMMGGGWGMIVGILVCLAVIGVVAWFVMHMVQDKQPPSLPQQPSPQRSEHGYQPSHNPLPETYQEDRKIYDSPKVDRYPYSQEQPLK